MAEVDSLTIQIKSSANAASSALDELISKLRELQSIANGGGINVAVSGIKNISTEAKSATSSLERMVKQFVSLVAVGRLLKNAITESMNYTETFNYFNVALKNYTADAEAYAQRVNSVLGINVEQWENAQATFMSLGTTFGITGDDAHLMSQQLTQLVYDLSSLKNVDPTVALQKMRSAFAGEIEPLRAWGVDLSKANLQLAATELGITKTFNAMTQAEKAYLRYYVIMKQTTDAQGDMARTLQSPANQLRLLKQALTECARALGNIFIPILQKVIPMLVIFVKVLTFVFEAIAKLFGFEYPDVQWYGDYSAGVGDLGDEMDKTGRKAKKLKQQLAGFDEINNLTTNKGGGGGVGGLGGDWASFELPTYDFLGGLEEKAAKVVQVLSAITPILIGIGVAIGVIVVGYNWASIMATGKKLLDGLIFGVQFFWAVLQANPIAAVIAAIAIIIGVLVSLYNNCETFRNWVDNTWAWLKGVFAAAQARFNKFFAAVFEWGYNTYTNIVNWFKGLPEWFATIWQTLVAKINSKWAAFKQGAVDAWNKIKEVFGNIPNWFKDKFATAWQKVKNVFSTGGQVFAGIKEGIENVFKSVVNALITGINRIITTPFQKIKDILTKIKNTDVLGFKPFSFLNVSWSIPQIPKLAQGGIVDNPRLAMIGENGAEAIVPLEHNTEWINKVAAQINDEGNDDVVKAIETLIDVVVNKQLVVDGASLARGISKEINRQTRIMGEGLVY